MIELRPYQIDIIDQVNNIAHPLIPLPTGGGKTIIAARIIKEAVDRGQRVLFIVHRLELVQQAVAKLIGNGVDPAVLAGSESSVYLGQPCIVASIQTLHARAFRSPRIERPPADLIFFDEAHHCRARTYLQIRKAYPAAKIIGLTATPARGDGRGLGGDLFTDLEWIVESSAAEDHSVPRISWRHRDYVKHYKWESGFARRCWRAGGAPRLPADGRTKRSGRASI